MALIQSKHMSVLFSELEQYSLRGNSALWEFFEEQLSATNQAYTAQQLLQWVDDYTASLIIENMSVNDTSNEIYIEAFNQGGMSGGVVDLRYWQDIMRPILARRCQQLEQGLQFSTQHHINSLLFIGDSHAQHNKLEELLESQGYDFSEDEDSHVKLVFVGDLIDNSLDSGTDHLALLETIKNLVERGHAYCLLGNHELNAIAWYLKDPNGQHYRDRTKPGNIKQHIHFLDQLGEDSATHKQWVEWFMTLPLYLNFGDVTAIHACWHDDSIQKLEKYLNADRSLKREHWADAFNDQHELFQLLETLLKGPEAHLPGGCSFHDKNGIERADIRVAWWKDRDCVTSYRDLAVVPLQQLEQIPKKKVNRSALAFNQQPLVPVVVGHYTLPATPFPERLSDNVVCVDFNAAKADNSLVGYYVDLDDWQESPCELVDDSRFAHADEVSVTHEVDSGVMQFVDAMLNQLPQAKPNCDFSSSVAKILLQQWDPIGIFDPEDFDDKLDDEYRNYENDVMRLAQAGDTKMLAAYLLLIERHYIGVERENAEQVCAKVAYRLVEEWQASVVTSPINDFDF